MSGKSLLFFKYLKSTLSRQSWTNFGVEATKIRRLIMSNSCPSRSWTTPPASETRTAPAAKSQTWIPETNINFVKSCFFFVLYNSKHQSSSLINILLIDYNCAGKQDTITLFTYTSTFAFSQELHFIKHWTNSNIIFETSNEPEHIHLWVIEIKHPIIGFKRMNIESKGLSLNHSLNRL